ncbi:aldehyde dehydrogenase family protein [Rhodococcus koreensis]|uniref:aldehyde dehydrogenase family protein n=1 Tax=Rhodococcus koreensis TaxID=99653 RepID=UPI00366ACA96
MTMALEAWTTALDASAAPTRLLIDGQWAASHNGETAPTFDPGNDDVLAQVAQGGLQDVEDAVTAARRAFDEERWTGLSGEKRGEILWRIAELIKENATEIGLLESRNMGSPVPHARAMVLEAAAQFRYYAGWADKIHGRTIDIGPTERRVQGYTLREPMGVAALIVPWNAPMISASKKLAPALASGCSCILKPANESPLTALWLGQLMQEAGVPNGVVNIVTGSGAIVGDALASHPDVDTVSFTGSTEVGRSIVNAATGNMKKLSLELGGKSPVIVMPDADLETAIPGVADAIFRNTGQVCAAGTRLFVHEAVLDEVVQGVAAVGRSLKVGYCTDPGVDLGPLISQKQLDRVTAYVESGRDDGARVVSGGERIGDRGNFFEPTVIVDVDQSMKMMREEIFGPVLGVMPFTDLDTAIKLANDTPYGLASSVWTRDVAVAHSIARKFRAGRVGINVHRAGGVYMPAGGYRQSGWGRESGTEGLDAFLETKSVVTLLDR